ncbi:MAG: hypothetical protein HRT35_07700 [Algicola sp.]|nr:hypothetical protein [Algicola sp.]
MVNYDRLANIVYPVTVESINAIIPQQTDNKSNKTKAESTVSWYRHYTLAALAFLLLAQLYWLLGH